MFATTGGGIEIAPSRRGQRNQPLTDLPQSPIPLAGLVGDQVERALLPRVVQPLHTHQLGNMQSA